MTDQKKRRRPRGGRAVASASTAAAVGEQASHAEAAAVRRLAPLPDWDWRTFPVYFALTLGLFAGVYIGAAAGYAESEGNSTPMTVAFIVSAILFGFALSRFTSRFLINKGWLKPKPKRNL